MRYNWGQVQGAVSGVPWQLARRVVRGGSWNNNRNNARAAYRNNNHPDNRNNNNGFRVAVVRRSTTHAGPFPRRLHAPVWPTGDGAKPGDCPAIDSGFQ